MKLELHKYVHQLHRLENHLTGPTIFPTMAIRWSLFAPQLSQWNWQTLLHAILRYWKDHHRTIWLCLKFILSHIAGIPWALTISIWIKRMNTVHWGFGGPKNQRQPYRFVFKEEDYNFFFTPGPSWICPAVILIVAAIIYLARWDRFLFLWLNWV